MITVEQAKINYITKGQVNEEVVGRDIAFSWEKCKMIGLNPSNPIKNENLNHKFGTNSFLEFCSKIIPASVSYFITDDTGMVYSKNIVDSELEEVDYLTEEYIGTTSFCIARNREKSSAVEKHEHFLDILSDFVSKTIILPKRDPIITLFLRGNDDGYITNSIQNSLSQYRGRITLKGAAPLAIDTNLSDYIDENDYRFNDLMHDLSRLEKIEVAVMIAGRDSKAVSWYLADLKSNHAGRFTCAGIPEYKLEDRLIDFFEKFSTVIIGEFDDAPPVVVAALSQMIDFYTLPENETQSNRKIYLIFECSDNYPDNGLSEKLSLSRINLNDYLTPRVKSVYENPCCGSSLEEIEKKQIKGVLEMNDWNISLASDILGISRATLYRKIKLYNIEKEF